MRPAGDFFFIQLSNTRGSNVGRIREMTTVHQLIQELV